MKSQTSKNFSQLQSILLDKKSSDTWDIIRIVSQIDEAPFLFDFGSGNVHIVRFGIETIDSTAFLFVPAVKSFLKKIEMNRYYELGSKRIFLWKTEESKDWILYVNRIKNLNVVNLGLKERIAWKDAQRKAVELPIDSLWKERILPTKNLLAEVKHFFSEIDDIDSEKHLSPPLKIIKLQHMQQIEITESTGSIIKNHEYFGLTPDLKILRLYVPYFLKDLITLMLDKMSEFNLIINRLKIFFKRFKKHELYAGFLWDPTLSGFLFEPKTELEKKTLMSQGYDFFAICENHSYLEHLSKTDPWQFHMYELDEDFFNDFDDTNDLFLDSDEFAESAQSKNKKKKKYNKT